MPLNPITIHPIKQKTQMYNVKSQLSILTHQNPHHATVELMNFPQQKKELKSKSKCLHA